MQRNLQILLTLFVLLWCGAAYGAAYTAAQNGNWSDDATWAGSGVPGDGDTADWGVYNITVDVNTTVGNSSGIVATGSNGNLTINSGVELVIKGSLNFSNHGGLTCNAGSTLTFGDTGAARFCRCLGGNGSLAFNGSSGSRCTVRSSGSGANVCNFSRGGTNHNRITATYTDFTKMGSSSAPNTVSAPAVMTDCTFTTCGTFDVNDIANTDNVTLSGFYFSGTTGSSSYLWTGTVAPSTGDRTISNGYFDKGAILAGDVQALSLTDVAFQGGSLRIGTLGTASGAFTTIDNVFFSGVTPGGTVALNIYVPGPVTRCAFVRDDTAHNIDVHNDSAGTYEFEENVFQTGVASDGGDSIVGMPSTNHSTATYSIHNNIVLASPNPTISDTLYNMAANTQGITLQINHNTSIGGETAVLEGTLEATAVGHTGHIGSFKSNLFVFDSGATGYGLEQYASNRSSDDNVDTGTLTAASGTTFTDSGAAWGTIFNDNTTLRILFTSGAASGQSTVITGNSSGTVGTVASWSGATPSTDAYKIFVANLVTAADANYNAFYNGKATGTIRRYDNTTTTSVQGYDGYYIDSGTPGANDLWATNPTFVDSTRIIATYDSAASGLANAATAWADTGSTYNVGDMVSSADASFHGNATINYRCISAHAPTGVANDKPGVGSSWRTYWELATAYRLRTDRTLIDSMVTWIQAGYAPTNAALQNAGSDGVTIGAVEGSFGSFTPKVIISRAPPRVPSLLDPRYWIRTENLIGIAP